MWLFLDQFILFNVIIFLISFFKNLRKLGARQCLVLYLFASLKGQNVFINQALAHQNGHTVVHQTS